MGDASGKESQDKPRYLMIIMPVFITALAGLAGTFIMSRYQDKMSATTIISQREQAESSLRATMFNTLISTIMGNDGKSKIIPPEHEVVLLEMLTLNFSENFEFKPLLIHVDETLERKINDAGESDRKQLIMERRHLVSASKKVVARQIAMINSGNKGEDKTVVERLLFTEPTDDMGYLDKQRRNYNAKVAFTRFSSFSEAVLKSGIGQEICLTSPDGNDLMMVDVRQSQREKDRFRVHIVASDISTHYLQKSAILLSQSSCRTMAVKPVVDPRYPTVEMSFAVTPFDFPLTDNTLLASGNRFAVTMESNSYLKKNRGLTSGKPSNVVLNVIWFPKSYFTARERPINFRDFRKKLGIVVK